MEEVVSFLNFTSAWSRQRDWEVTQADGGRTGPYLCQHRPFLGVRKGRYCKDNPGDNGQGNGRRGGDLRWSHYCKPVEAFPCFSFTFTGSKFKKLCVIM